MEVLITVSVTQWRHAFHPKMISEGADLAHSLFKAAFDLEAQAIEANDVNGTERGIRAHEKAGASCGMNERDEAYDAANRTPQQITNTIVKDDIALTIDRTGHLAHGCLVLEQGLELNLFAIE